MKTPFLPRPLCLVSASALVFTASSFGQAICEQRFNDATGIELKDGALLGADGSGVSGKPGDKAYSADPSSAPTAYAVVTNGPDPVQADEITVTAWYKPRDTVAGATTLFNAFGSLLIWEENRHEWTWRIGAKPFNPETKMYWFFSGKPQTGAWSTPGDWTFVALVWKRADKKANFYQGTPTSSVMQTREMVREEDVEPLEIGGDAKGSLGNDTNKKDRIFNGEIDDFRVFTKALDETALEKIRQADLKNEPVKLQ